MQEGGREFIPLDEKYQKLLYKWAWKWHYSTGEDVEELFQEMVVVFFSCQADYDPAVGPFTVFLYYVVRNHLVAYYLPHQDIRLNGVFSLPFPDMCVESVDVEDRVLFLNTLEQLSVEAQQICRMIFETPELFLTHAPKLSRGKVKDELRKRGWSWRQIWDGFRELKSFIQLYTTD